MVHRRRHHDGRGRGEQHRGRQLVGESVRHLGEDVGGGRRHHDEIGFLRQAEVAHLALLGERELVLINLLVA
jgi:hypothetical protein